MDPTSRLPISNDLPVTRMPAPRSTLRRDFRIFLEPGFLLTLVLVGAISAVTIALLVGAAEKYGIPLSGYWR